MKDLYAEFVERKSASRETLLIGLEMIPPEVMHAALGVVTEASEFADVLKKTLYKNVTIDWVNLDEEVGDTLFFIQMYINYRNELFNTDLTFVDYLVMNTAKLNKRYSDKFSTDEAINRDLGQERELLEGMSNGQPD